MAEASPVTTRSRVVLEIASELAAGPDRYFGQAKVLLRRQGNKEWTICLFGSNTEEGIETIVNGEASLAMINPTASLVLAYRGEGKYKNPQPVRTIGVIPSVDEYVFAVKPETGLTTFEEIGEKQFPLRVSLRGELDHCLHSILDDIVAAAGFSLDDIQSWGGEVRREGGIPFPGGPKFEAIAKGEINAIFDEASDQWVNEGLDAGLKLLPLSEATVTKLEATGYRRAYLEKKVIPRLPDDVLTIDFSGWPIFVHAEAPDELVTEICAALDARKANIPWQGEGPLPIERMCREARDAPQDVPLHPAAERYWRECGYLP